MFASNGAISPMISRTQSTKSFIASWKPFLPSSCVTIFSSLENQPCSCGGMVFAGSFSAQGFLEERKHPCASDKSLNDHYGFLTFIQPRKEVLLIELKLGIRGAGL